MSFEYRSSSQSSDLYDGALAGGEVISYSSGGGAASLGGSGGYTTTIVDGGSYSSSGAIGGGISSLVGGLADGGSYSSGGSYSIGGGSGGAISIGGGRADAMSGDLLALAASGASGGAISSSYGGGAGGSIGIYNAGGSGGAGAGGQIYVSQIEQSIVRSNNPYPINETEEITVNGQRGIWANRAEVVNWRGPIPITQYEINQDASPEIITKRSEQTLDYVQELAVRYLRPPAPPAPGEIIIQQQSNTLTPPAPPLIIRQQPPRPPTPEPLVIREAPPQPPAQVGRKVITISGKRLPPPPRKVIIERLAPLPAKPQSVIVERWLPYAQNKRRVIFQRAAQVDPVIVRPRNVIVQWEAPRVNIRREVKYLGVINANPAEYVQRYGGTLRAASDIPEYVANIKTPDGLVLAANYRYNNLHELEGDIQALRLVDLDRAGLAEYRAYLQRLGISYDARYGSNSSLNNLDIGSAGFSELNISSASAAGASSSSASISVEALAAEIFSSIDANADDRISISEAESAFMRLNSRLGRNYGEDDVRSFFTRFDTNKDGFLSFREFKNALFSFFRLI